MGYVIDCLLTVPHGAPGNDVAAVPVARALHQRLRAAGLASALLINRVDRLDFMDGNREESRGTPFREAIDALVPVRLLLDMHSFPDNFPRYTGKDMVLLHTPGVQELDFLEDYAERLRVSAAVLGHGELVVEVMAHQFPDDVVERAVALGQPSSANMLIEHNEQGDCALYACVHELAVRSLFASWEER